MTALSPRQMFLLDLACQPIQDTFGHVYLVGTAAEKREKVRDTGFRDVDVRVMLSDKRYDRMVKAMGQDAMAFLGLAIGQYLASITDLPIDFQFQRTTEANDRHRGVRNPLGFRGMENFGGDATPER